MTDWEIMAEALREPGKSTVKWTATSSRVRSIERGRCFVEDQHLRIISPKAWEKPETRGIIIKGTWSTLPNDA